MAGSIIAFVWLFHSINICLILQLSEIPKFAENRSFQLNPMTLRPAPFSPFILLNAGLTDHIPDGFWVITIARNTNFNTPIRFTIFPMLDPSLMRAF
jgi:hypothetical protein